MKISNSSGFIAAALLLFFVSTSWADRVIPGEEKDNDRQVIWLSNNQVKCSIFFNKGRLITDRLEVQPQWALKLGIQPFMVETDADFCVDVIWAYLQAPGKINNAENPVMFSKQNFIFGEA